MYFSVNVTFGTRMEGIEEIEPFLSHGNQLFFFSYHGNLRGQWPLNATTFTK